jgi:hypothetical protein
MTLFQELVIMPNIEQNFMPNNSQSDSYAAYNCFFGIARNRAKLMQSIFRPASWREMLGEHSGGGCRDGGLKNGLD